MNFYQFPGKIFKVYDEENQNLSRPDYWGKEVTDRINSANHRFFLGFFLNSGSYHFLNKYLPSQGLMLDGGCGANYLSKVFSNADRRIIGIDYSLANLSQGKNLYPGNPSVQGDLNALPFASEKFDTVISYSTAEHLEEGPHKLFQESYRILKKGGTFLLLMPTYNTEDLCRHFLKAAFKFKHPDTEREISHFPNNKIYRRVNYPNQEQKAGFFAYWFSKAQIQYMLLHSNFKIRKMVPLDLMGGLLRSRLLSAWATQSMGRFPMVTKRLQAKEFDWAQQLLVCENIYSSHYKYYLHNFIGNFYRYLLAFVCIK